MQTNRGRRTRNRSSIPIETRIREANVRVGRDLASYIFRRDDESQQGVRRLARDHRQFLKRSATARTVGLLTIGSIIAARDVLFATSGIVFATIRFCPATTGSDDVVVGFATRSALATRLRIIRRASARLANVDNPRATTVWGIRTKTTATTRELRRDRVDYVTKRRR